MIVYELGPNDWASDENGIHRSQSGRRDQTVNKSPK
jgi:hypothetical protein